MLRTAARGKVTVFDRKTSGCPGGGTALGFGNCYTGFPIERLLSTGGTADLPGGHTFDMGAGEWFFDVSQRGKLDADLLCYTMPFALYQQMEASVDDSFLGTEMWEKLRARW